MSQVPDISGQLAGTFAGTGAGLTGTLGGAGAGSLLSIVGAINPFSVGIALFAAWYQGRKQDQAERERRLQAVKAALGQKRYVGSGGRIPLAYGYTKSSGIPVYSTNGDNVPYIPSGAGIIGDLDSLDNSAQGWGWGREGQFVLEQFALCLGETDGLVGVRFDGKELEKSDFNHYAVVEFKNAGEASPMATAFTGFIHFPGGSTGTGTYERDQQSRGEGISKATICYNLLPSNLKFNGPPEVEFFYRARKVRTITAQHTLSANKIFTNNLALILLDYLLDDVVGVGMDVSQIDLVRWKKAADLCDVVVQGTGAALSSIPGNLNTEFGNTHGSYEDWFAAEDLWVGGAGQNGRVRSGLRPSMTFDSAVSDTHPLRRWDFNGEFDAFDDVIPVISAIMAPCPGAILAFSDEGKWYLDIPDPSRTEAQQSVHTITDSHRAKPLEIHYENAATIISKLNMTFDSVNKDYSEEGIPFPKSGSNIETQLATRLNGKIFRKSKHVKGIFDRYHAYSYCHNVVSQSLRRVYVEHLFNENIVLLAGQIVEVNSEQAGENKYARVIERTPSADEMTFQYKLLEYDVGDYAWIPDTRDTIDITTISPDGPQAPTALTATNSARGGFSGALLRWTLPAVFSNLVNRFEIQTKDDDGDWQELIIVDVGDRISSVQAEGARTYYDRVVPGASKKYRIRSLTITGRHSAWVESNTLVVKELKVAPPQNITEIVSGDDFRIEYDDPDDTTDIRGYFMELEQKTDSVGWKVIDWTEDDGLTGADGSGRSFANLKGGTYRIRIKSVSNSFLLDSDWVYSNEVVAVDGPDEVPLSPAKPLTVFDSVNDEIDVTYYEPANNGGSELTYYAFQLYKFDTKPSDDILYPTTTPNKILLRNALIDNGTRGKLQSKLFVFDNVEGDYGWYYVRYAALNANSVNFHERRYSSWSVPIVIEQAVEIPTNQRFRVENGNLWLAWDKPSGNPTGYEVDWRHRTIGTNNWTNPADKIINSGNTLEVNLGAPASGKEYEARIKATGGSNSGYSSRINWWPDPTAPGTPTVGSGNAPLFSWVAASYAKRYRVEVTGATVWQMEVTTTSVGSIPLNSGAHEVTVTAINDTGETVSDETEFNIAAAGAPLNVDVTPQPGAIKHGTTLEFSVSPKSGIGTMSYEAVVLEGGGSFSDETTDTPLYAAPAALGDRVKVEFRVVRTVSGIKSLGMLQIEFIIV